MNTVVSLFAFITIFDTLIFASYQFEIGVLEAYLLVRYLRLSYNDYQVDISYDR